MAHVVDLTHYLVGPIDRLSGRTATMIPRRPRQPTGRARTSAASRPTTSSTSRTRTGPAALFEFGGGTVGSLEASRVVVGPRIGLRFEVHGTRGRAVAGSSSA